MDVSRATINNVPMLFLIFAGMMIDVAAHAHGAPNQRAVPETLPPPDPVSIDLDAAPRDDFDGTCDVTLRLVDGETGEPITGLIRVTDSEGRRIAMPGLLSRSAGISPDSFGPIAFRHLDSWTVLPKLAVVQLPQETLQFETLRGPRYVHGRHTEDLRGRDSAEVELIVRPLEHQRETAWYAGNCHLHVQRMTIEEAERYACEVAAADGLDIVFFSYLERAGADRHYTSNNFTAADLERFTARSGVLFGYGEEYRHNIADAAAGYGHAMFLDLQKLILPASLGFAITRQGNDDEPLRNGIRHARDQDATVLWCHGTRGFEDIPSWLAGLLDVQMIFDQGSTGNYEEALYRYLNVGLRVPLATGTDWFFRDMAQVYAQLDGALTTESWLEAVRAGRSFITNGPLLTLAVDGTEPGGTLHAEPGSVVHVAASAIGNDDFQGLEIVVNGEVVASAEAEPADHGFAASVQIDRSMDRSAWIAARVAPFPRDYDAPEPAPVGFNAFGKPLFAHTSPVYVDVAGEKVFVPEAAQSLLDELRTDREFIADAGTFTNDDIRNAVLALYDAAMEILVERLVSNR